MYHPQLSRVVGASRQVDYLMYGNYFEGRVQQSITTSVLVQRYNEE